MKKRIIPVIMVIAALTMCFSGPVYAQEEETIASPGITPDSPFYFADGWAEQFGLMFAFNAETKAKRAMQYAEEKLAEAGAMAAQNKAEATTRATNQYQKHLQAALQSMERAGEDDIDTQTAVALAATRQLRYCNEIAAGVSEDSQGALTQARDRARDCQETALGCMAQGDPEEAARLHLQLMEQQLTQIQAMGEETEPVRLQNALQEFTRLNGLGEEIMQTAEGKGKGAEVGQMYGQAAEYHYQVMSQVHSRIQAQLQPALEEAMQVCLQSCQQTATELKVQAQAGQVSEDTETSPEGDTGNAPDKGQPGGSGGNGKSQ